MALVDLLQFVSDDLFGECALQQVIYFPLGEETADLTGMVRDTIRLSHSAKVHILNLACIMSYCQEHWTYYE